MRLRASSADENVSRRTGLLASSFRSAWAGSLQPSPSPQLVPPFVASTATWQSVHNLSAVQQPRKGRQ